MIQALLAESKQEGGTDQEERKLAAIAVELGAKPATLEPGSNWGTLILDATCVPDDIPYPVDLRLLEEARKATGKIIDNLFEPLEGKIPRKPRCNRDKAHHRFLAISKKKKGRREEIQESKRFQSTRSGETCSR